MFILELSKKALSFTYSREMPVGLIDTEAVKSPSFLTVKDQNASRFLKFPTETGFINYIIAYMA